MIRKPAFAAIIFVAALVVAPAMAGAHVDIAPDGAVAADGTVKAKLSVPNECVNSDTRSLALVFPSTPALTTVTPAPVAGWTAQVDKAPSGVVTRVTFTGTLTGSNTVDFSFTLGAVPPGMKEVDFTAVQTCSVGDPIRWVDKTAAGGAEPSHPFPRLDLGSSTSGPSSTTANSLDTSSTTKVAVAAKAKSSGSSTGILLGIVAASLVLIGAGAVLSRSNRSTRR